MSAQMKVGCET